MMYVVEIISDGLTYRPNLMKISSEFQVILKVLPKKFGRL
jgi:hypothetical protein